MGVIHKGQRGPFYAIESGVGEHSRKPARRPGGSDGSVRLVVPSVKRAEALARLRAVRDLGGVDAEEAAPRFRAVRGDSPFSGV